MSYSRLDSSKEWAILTSISDKCIFNNCDGSGLNHLKHLKTGEEVFQKCGCREEELRKKQLIEVSKIPPKFVNVKIGDFEISEEIYGEDEEELAKALTAKLMTINFVRFFDKIKDKRGFYLYSETKGSGKTRLACSLANVLHDKYNLSVLFTTSDDMLNSVRGTFEQSDKKTSKYTTKELSDLYQNVDVLIVDDLGTEKSSEWVVEFLTSLFNKRLNNNAITLVTSNYKLNHLDFEYSKLKENHHDTERIVERLDAMVIQVELPAVNVRRQESLKQTIEYRDLLYTPLNE